MDKAGNPAMARICRQQAVMTNTPGAKEALLDLAEFYEANETIASAVRRKLVERRNS